MSVDQLLSLEVRTRRHPKDAFLPEILALLDFSSISDANQTASIDDIVNILSIKTDVFLTHNWGKNQDNHKIVAQINDLLQNKNLTTWFDAQKMEGAIVDKMSEGIDNARCVAVFITETYGEKVSGNDDHDNCKMEFRYAHLKKKPMIPIVMEPVMKNTSLWKGQLGMVLGHLLYIDMSDMSQLDVIIDEIYHAIVAKVGMPLKVLMERQLAMLTNTSSLPLFSQTTPTVSRPTTPVIVGIDMDAAHLKQQKRCEDAMFSYFNSHDVHSTNSMHYAKIIYAAKISTYPLISCLYFHHFSNVLSSFHRPLQLYLGTNLPTLTYYLFRHKASIEKLAKKLGKEPRGEEWGNETMAFLMSLGVDEEGADDIVTALKKSALFTVIPSVMRFDDDENRNDDVTMLPSDKGLDDMNDGRFRSNEKSALVTNTEVLSGLANSPTKASSSTNASLHGNGNDTTRSSTHSTHSTDRASFERSSLKEEPLKELEGKEDKEFKGHKGSIMCLIQLTDGRICSAGGSNDATIKIWQRKTGTCDVTLIG